MGEKVFRCETCGYNFIGDASLYYASCNRCGRFCFDTGLDPEIWKQQNPDAGPLDEQQSKEVGATEEQWKTDIGNMAKDIHFIKTVVLVYVILSIIAGIIIGFSLL